MAQSRLAGRALVRAIGNVRAHLIERVSDENAGPRWADNEGGVYRLVGLTTDSGTPARRTINRICGEDL
jgi:hypothetical protein